MADAMFTTGTRSAATVNEQTAFSRTGEVLRDIARGGIAGAIVGIVVGGPGGRLIMRLARSSTRIHRRTRACGMVTGRECSRSAGRLWRRSPRYRSRSRDSHGAPMYRAVT